jgi:hypothetical protein
MSKAAKRAETVIDNWKKAYRDMNGKEPPHAFYRNGWVSIDGALGKRRVSELEAMAKRLLEANSPSA